MYLVRARQQSSEAAGERVQGDIQPAADGIVGRVLPRLESVSVRQVMGRLPIVEGFVAVLDRRKGGGNQVGDEKDVKGLDRFDGVRAGFPVGEELAALAFWEAVLQDETPSLSDGPPLAVLAVAGDLLLLRMARAGMMELLLRRLFRLGF